MAHATYIGPIVHLKGCTAILRFPPEEGYVVAQFDDATLTLSGVPADTVLSNSLGVGWTKFKREEFEVSND